MISYINKIKNFLLVILVAMSDKKKMLLWSRRIKINPDLQQQQ
jgi:hypothetical protein